MNRGGWRPNAGRKKGSGKWREPTRAMRLPISRIDEVLKLLQSPPGKAVEVPAEPPLENLYWRPLYQSSILTPFHTSMPEPADKFNLNTYLLPHPQYIVFVRAPDKAMTGVGIDEGDILIVDRHHPLTPGRIVVAIVNDELVIRQLSHDEGKLILLPANPLYSALHLTGDIQFTLLGVAVTVRHQL